jgi:hypothetical protein
VASDDGAQVLAAQVLHHQPLEAARRHQPRLAGLVHLAGHLVRVAQAAGQLRLALHEADGLLGGGVALVVGERLAQDLRRALGVARA